MIRQQMFIATALLAGVAIGYFVKDDPIPAEVLTRAEDRTKMPVADKGSESSVRALRRRIAELEKALAERDDKSERAISNAVAEAVRVRPPEPPHGNWRERMEEIRKNDPERYVQMTNRFANWRQRRSEQARNKIDFLSSIDISRMSARAKRTHVALQELLSRRESVEQRLQQADLSEDDRHQLMRELHSANHELRRLNGEERSNLFDETIRNLGFGGEDAGEISATFRDIIEATDGGFGPPHGGRHGNPPPGGLDGR